MTNLNSEDLKKIEEIVEKVLEKQLQSIKTDISQMKADINLLANLNQLDEIRKEPRLRKMYDSKNQIEA
jgi:hypothetical protein